MAVFIPVEGTLTDKGREAFRRATYWHSWVAASVPNPIAAGLYIDVWLNTCEVVLADLRRHEPADGPDPR